MERVDTRPKLLVPGSLRLLTGAAPAGIAPVDFITSWLRRRMPEFGHRGGRLADRVLIVLAKTGAGKSTVLPVAIFRLLRSEATPPRQPFRGPGVICTQPRVLTAVALANDVSSQAWNPDMVMGLTVGYRTGPLSNAPPTGLVFATAGVLAVQLRRLSDSEIMERYRFIIVDEAHERALDCDIGLAQLRDFYARNAGNERLPFLLVMSATFDPVAYVKYFGLDERNIVAVEGSAFPIEKHWPSTGVNDFAVAAAATALRIHREHLDDPPERADILIFIPGAAEATTVLEALSAAPDDIPFLTLSINREVVASQSGDYHLLFAAPRDLPRVGGRAPLRRIIVTTAVAETGLTVRTLRYVIDSGWTRSSEVYPPWGAEGLITRPAPHNRIAQRMGRAGRLFAGDFYPLYTENVYAALDEQQLPDICVTGISDRFLAVVAWQQRQKKALGERAEFRIEDISLLDVPPADVFIAAYSTASMLGFVSPRAPLPVSARPGLDAPQLSGNGLTPLGWVAADFNWTPTEGVRVLLAGYMWDAAAADLITAVAAFGTAPGSLYSERATGLAPGLRAALPSFLLGGSDDATYARTKLVIADDFAEVVLIFDAFAAKVDAAEGDIAAVAAWCEGNKLDISALLALSARRDVYFDEAIGAGLNPYRLMERRLAALGLDDFATGIKRFKRCLYDGLRGRVLVDSVTAQGLQVKVAPLLDERIAGRLGISYRPRVTLTDAIVLRTAPKSDEPAALLYTPQANLVSVLDGFVNVDDDFGAPRSFPPT